MPQNGSAKKMKRQEEEDDDDDDDDDKEMEDGRIVELIRRVFVA